MSKQTASMPQSALEVHGMAGTSGTSSITLQTQSTSGGHHSVSLKMLVSMQTSSPPQSALELHAWTSTLGSIWLQTQTSSGGHHSVSLKVMVSMQTSCQPQSSLELHAVTSTVGSVKEVEQMQVEPNGHSPTDMPPGSVTQ
jgi:hypothetical protein